MATLLVITKAEVSTAMINLLKLIRTSIVTINPQFNSYLIKLWRIGSPYVWFLRNLVTLQKEILFFSKENKILLHPKGHIARLMWTNSFEKHERDFIEQHTKPNMNVVNIGSNIGLYTLIASKLVGSKGEVHSFEPSSLNFSRLKDNIILNKVENVILNNIALSDFEGKLGLIADPDNKSLDSHYSTKKLTESHTSQPAIEHVECTTLDGYWRKHCETKRKNPIIDLMIIDVEGAELSVLNGSTEVIQSSPSLIILIECTENLEKLDLFLKKHGFSFYFWDKETQKLLKTKMQRGNICAFKLTSKGF